MDATQAEEYKLLVMRWKPEIILLSYFLSVQACYSAVLMLQIRYSKVALVLASFCLSICGIWSMHFIGMGAMEIDTRVKFDAAWTVASALFAFVCTSVAVVIVDARIADKQVSSEAITIEAHAAALKNAPHKSLVSAALLIACGVCTMHYTGVHAIKTEARRTYNIPVIIASSFVAFFAGLAALYFAFVLPITRRYTVPTSLVAGVAVCGMHYTGMYGVAFYLPDSQRTAPSSSIQGSEKFIAFASSFLSASVLAYSSFLLRRRLNRASKRAEAAAQAIVQGQYSNLLVEHEAGEDESIRRITEAYKIVGHELRNLKTYIPQSVLARYEGVEVSDTESEMFLEELTVTSDKPSASLSTPGSTPLPGTPPAPSSNSSSSRRVLKKISLLSFNIRHYHEYLSTKRYETMMQLQSRVLDEVAVVATVFSGIIDTFQGDHVSITFNAVRPAPSHAVNCGLSAVAIVEKTRDICQITQGLATGPAIVGSMGTQTMKRINAVGHVCTQAPILERLCKQYGVQSLASPACYTDLVYAAHLRHVDVVLLPGYSKPAIVSEVVWKRQNVPAMEWMYDVDRISHADYSENQIFDTYLAGDLDKGRELLADFDDLPNKQQLENMLALPPVEYVRKTQGRFYMSSLLDHPV